jgi:hypothetical protein
MSRRKTGRCFLKADKWKIVNCGSVSAKTQNNEAAITQKVCTWITKAGFVIEI